MKEFFKRCRNKVLAVAAAVPAAVAMSVAACAEETSVEEASPLAGAADQISAQFTTAASDIVPIILGVLGAGLSIFIIFVGIKLAKKMFGTVSKGG